MQGLNNLLSISLKYIGLLSLTPLRGILPGIAAKTYATRKLVGSMYHSLHYEKQEKIYSALVSKSVNKLGKDVAEDVVKYIKENF